MKAWKLALAAICIVGAIAPQTVFAGVGPTPGTVPEPTALLVWAGLAGIGGLFFYRRNRDTD